MKTIGIVGSRRRDTVEISKRYPIALNTHKTIYPWKQEET